MENIDFGNLIIWFIVLLFSLSFHEAAHAWTSERFGDDTGRMQGRITLNPLPHIDPLGTLLFPIMGFITGLPLLGWAKPVETNPLRWRDKTRANISVSAAGPISNLILAIVAFVVIKVMLMSGVVLAVGGNILFSLFIPAPGQPEFMEPLIKLLNVMLTLNISLCIFNLIPIPPLDGSHVLESLLPYEMGQAFAQIRPYGFLLLIGLLYLGVFSAIFFPIFNLVWQLLQ